MDQPKLTYSLALYTCKHNVHVHNEPQIPWLQTAVRVYHTGLDVHVKMEVTQCTGSNTRRHQLHWGDREWAYYMSCTRNKTV